MKNIVISIMLILTAKQAYANEYEKVLNLTCQDYSWSGVEALVEPYLDDSLYTALAMQGQSSGYRTSIAAAQAMDNSLPDVIKKILNSLIEANC